MTTKFRATVITVDVRQPLFVWTPGGDEEAVPFEAIAYANSRRWNNNAKPKPTTVLMASREAHGIFGSNPRERRPHDLEHDLAVSELFFQMRTTPGVEWTLEDSLNAAAFNGYRPDAVVQEGTTSIVLDVLGRGYKTPKVKQTFSHFRGHNLQLR